MRYGYREDIGMAIYNFLAVLFVVIGTRVIVTAGEYEYIFIVFK